jgi:hypothetical protein
LENPQIYRYLVHQQLLNYPALPLVQNCRQPHYRILLAYQLPTQFCTVSLEIHKQRLHYQQHHRLQGLQCKCSLRQWPRSLQIDHLPSPSLATSFSCSSHVTGIVLENICSSCSIAIINHRKCAYYCVVCKDCNVIAQSITGSQIGWY